MDAFSRTRMLLGDAAMEKLAASRVAVFGLGGVGSFAVEALARSGLGALDLVDHDTLGQTNLNRQLFALHSTLGMPKAEAARARVLDIHPRCRVTARVTFYGPDTAASFDFTRYDYVLDCIDTVTGKLALIQAARAAGVPILCCLGTGNKLDPTAFRISDLSETSVCPLARILRKECRRRGIENLKVLWSPEEPVDPTPDSLEELPQGRRSLPGSCAFVPSVAGLLLAGEVIKDLIKL